MSYTGNLNYTKLDKNSSDEEIISFIRETRNGNRCIKDVIDTDYVHDLKVRGISESRAFRLIRESR